MDEVKICKGLASGFLQSTDNGISRRREPKCNPREGHQLFKHARRPLLDSVYAKVPGAEVAADGLLLRSVGKADSIVRHHLIIEMDLADLDKERRLPICFLILCIVTFDKGACLDRATVFVKTPANDSE